MSVGSGYGDGARGCFAGKYASVTSSSSSWSVLQPQFEASSSCYIVGIAVHRSIGWIFQVLACSASHQILVGKNHQSCLGLPLPPARLTPSVLSKLIAGVGAVVGGRLLDLKLVAIRCLRDV